MNRGVYGRLEEAVEMIEDSMGAGHLGRARLGVCPFAALKESQSYDLVLNIHPFDQCSTVYTSY